MKKIYIAGFSVFAKNAKEIGERHKKICEKYGFEGLYPLDNEIEDDCPKWELAEKIFAANLRLIDQADYVVADLNPFRGKCMDDGTAFEIGYATANDKQIYGFIEDERPLVEKIGTEDENGYRVEDFGLPLNLMIAETAFIVEGTFEDAVAEIAKKP